MSRIEIAKKHIKLGIGDLPDKAFQPNQVRPMTEQGYRTTPENSMKYIYRQMWVDPELRSMILDIRLMDRIDTRVKKIHDKLSRSMVKGGLLLDAPSTEKSLHNEWKKFMKMIKLNKHAKLESDARGLMMEGNLPLQWVIDQDRNIVQAVRMPSETIVPNVGTNGRFIDPQKAYSQHDLLEGKVIADFALYQITLVRLTPDNYDDMGSLGRPYLASTRGSWKKLVMSEEDLVIRRRQRAALRMSHTLEGASIDELDAYKESVLADAHEITTEYFSNKKGGVTPLQGDANLDHIKDIGLLLDCFFAGAPAPKGLFGYTEDLNRDILEDLKRDFYEEVDALQDALAEGYEEGFRLQLLLNGINPEATEFKIKFAERRTETPNQATDRALKQQAIGASLETVLKTAGLDPKKEKDQRESEAQDFEPYPESYDIDGSNNSTVKITPGNAQKNESATSISN